MQRIRIRTRLVSEVFKRNSSRVRSHSFVAYSRPAIYALIGTIPDRIASRLHCSASVIRNRNFAKDHVP